MLNYTNAICNNLKNIVDYKIIKNNLDEQINNHSMDRKKKGNNQNNIFENIHD